MTSISSSILEQRKYFAKGETLDTTFRIKALKKLKAAIIENEQEILDALNKDLNKAPFEAYVTEIGIVLEEVNDSIKHLRQWNRPKRVRTPITQFKASSYIVPEPYGVVLVMSPWNYPFELTIAPLVGAIAGGNCAIVKPSAYSPATSAILAKLLRSRFEERYIRVIEGGRDANQQLLREKFDYIFFTGSVDVGKLVMESASKHLTPVTLELGGKSPCIVNRDANLELAARRIVWGKSLNAGQTCVAPDYLLVHSDVKEKLIVLLRKYIREFLGEASFRNPEFPRIINEKHFNRLKGLIKSGKIAVGGESNPQTLQIAFTVLRDVNWDDPVMQEEIFGPILPILEFNSMEQVIEKVNSRPKPLALYLFTTSRSVETEVLKRITFGGGCVNDTIVHLGTSHMPFGGVGESGMGGYHGKWSFDTFTHYKSVLKKSNLLDIRLRYAPYKDKLKVIKKLMG